MDREDIVGTWRLVSMRAYSSDGEEAHALGTNARGFITYSADGYMTALLINPDRELFGTTDPLAGSVEQLAEAARGCISYAGQFDIQGGNVRHLVQVSLIPDWMGTTLERRYDLHGQQLTLTTPPMRLNNKEVTSVLVWERVANLS